MPRNNGSGYRTRSPVSSRPRTGSYSSSHNTNVNVNRNYSGGYGHGYGPRYGPGYGYGGGVGLGLTEGLLLGTATGALIGSAASSPNTVYVQQPPTYVQQVPTYPAYAPVVEQPPVVNNYYITNPPLGSIYHQNATQEQSKQEVPVTQAPPGAATDKRDVAIGALGGLLVGAVLLEQNQTSGQVKEDATLPPQSVQSVEQSSDVTVTQVPSEAAAHYGEGYRGGYGPMYGPGYGPGYGPVYGGGYGPGYGPGYGGGYGPGFGEGMLLGATTGLLLGSALEQNPSSVQPDQSVSAEQQYVGRSSSPIPNMPHEPKMRSYSTTNPTMGKRVYPYPTY